MIHRHEIRVRYGETDQMGVVHHRVYALYFEEARTELMRALGLSYAGLEKRGIFLPVVELSVRFRKGPAYDAVLVVESRLSELSRVRMRLDYRAIDREDGSLVAEGYTVHASTDPNMRLTRIPGDVAEMFRAVIEEGAWE